MIVSLSSKIVVTNDLEKEITTHTETIKESEQARLNLQNQLGEASNLALRRANETQGRETQLNGEINSLKKNVDGLNHTIRERDQTIHEKEFTISQRDKEINGLNLKLENLSEMKSLNEKYAQQVNDAENSRIDLQKKFEK